MIEMGKKYRTKDGRDVKIYAIEPAGLYPVHGAIKSVNGFWCSRMWDHTGKMHSRGRTKGSEGRLIEVLPEVTVRRYAFASDRRVFTADIPTFFNNLLGAIDITHNGKEIVKVEVVK